MLEAARGEQLHADADAEERPAFFAHGVRQSLDHAGDGVEAALAIGEGADARQHDAVGIGDDIGIGGEEDGGAGALAGRALQCLGRRMQVARTVVDDRDAHAAPPAACRA